MNDKDPWRLNIVRHSTHAELALYTSCTVAYARLDEQSDEAINNLMQALLEEQNKRSDPQMGVDS